MKNIKLFDGFQEEQSKKVNENVGIEFSEIFDALGYRQGFEEFIEDNPGAVDVLLEWLAGVPEFARKLKGLDIMGGYLDESVTENTDAQTEVRFSDYDCILEFGKYNNDRTAITLIEKSTGEPVAVATVNLPEVNVPEGHVVIKNYSENVPEEGDDMLTVLVNAGVISKPVKMVGNINAPMCKLLKTV